MTETNIDLSVGKVFGKLKVIGIFKKEGSSVKYATCMCSCGSEHKARLADLKSGNTKSCGCWKVIADSLPKSHGMSKTRPHIIWCGMIARTTNLKEPSYKDYGARGITLCDRWKSFENFWDDMQEGYSDELELDRIDVNGNYCKENCRWATLSMQGHNKRKKEDCISEYMGVTLDNKTNKWRARIAVTKSYRKHLGMFHTQIEAAIAYDNASEEIYGDRPNKTVK